MELTKDEMITIGAVLKALMEEVPYREANKYLGEITIDRAWELHRRLEEEFKTW